MGIAVGLYVGTLQKCGDLVGGLVSLQLSGFLVRGAFDGLIVCTADGARDGLGLFVGL